MDEKNKELFMWVADILSGDLSEEQQELYNLRKSCRLRTLILTIICAVVILCDYFVF